MCYMQNANLGKKGLHQREQDINGNQLAVGALSSKEKKLMILNVRELENPTRGQPKNNNNKSFSFFGYQYHLFPENKTQTTQLP